MNLAIALVALLLDVVLVYPKLLQSVLGHPVQWVGAFISWSDEKLNPKRSSIKDQKRGGIALVLALVVMGLVVGVLLTAWLRVLPYGWLGEALLASVLLAGRQLADAVRNVQLGLEGSLNRGREAVAHIVGRDTTHLDEAEVARAAVETLAENASDGLFAPLFWLLVGGLPGLMIYKAINTADSMIGHKSAKYLHFGWASARADDVLNLIPSRLTALLIALASVFLTFASPGSALGTAIRDAGKHQSPNAGWPEAAMAGALGLALGGMRSYDGQVLHLPQMGNGKRALTPADIQKALTIFATTRLLALVALGLALLVWH